MYYKVCENDLDDVENKMKLLRDIISKRYYKSEFSDLMDEILVWPSKIKEKSCNETWEKSCNETTDICKDDNIESMIKFCKENGVTRISIPNRFSAEIPLDKPISQKENVVQEDKKMETCSYCFAIKTGPQCETCWHLGG